MKKLYRFLVLCLAATHGVDFFFLQRFVFLNILCCITKLEVVLFLETLLDSKYFDLQFRKNFGGANLFITLDRLEMMDMTIPYHIDRACFMVPKAKVMKL